MKKFINSLPIIPLIIFLAIIVIGFLSVNQNRKVNLIDERLANNKAIPLPNFSLPDLYDLSKSFSKDDLTGKISVINIFASWCTTCYAEHKYLFKIADNKNINIYGIAWNDIRDKTINYLEKQGNPYLRVAIDNKGVFTKILKVRGVPETFIVNEKKEIIYRYQGNINDAVVSYITKLSTQQ